MRKLLKIAAGVTAAAGLAAVASAATVNANLAIGARVDPVCTLGTQAVAFGPFSGTQIDATGTITATCVNGTNYNVGLDAGTSAGATVTTRKMTSGANVLPYSLYSDNSRTVNWGNTVGTDTVAGVGTGSAQNLTVYARLPAGTVPPPGVYSDTVQATITF